MTFCRLIVWMASTLLLLTLLPFLLDWLIRSPIGERLKGMCDKLCRTWAILAFLLGLVLGGVLFCCWPDLRDWVTGNECRRNVFMALFALLLLLYYLLMHIARCGMKSVPWIYRFSPKQTASVSGRGISAWWLIVLLAMLILYLVIRCCGEYARSGVEFDLCARLTVAALLLFVLMTGLRYLAIRICESHDPKGDECRRTVRRWVWLVILAEIVTAFLIYRCCADLKDGDYDLAMIAIWWDGNHAGDETGVHLRWSFRYDPDLGRLTFPEQGFDLQRRETGTSAWQTLNSERITPVIEWGDEAAAPVGEMWRPQAVARLHPDDWDRFRGEPFDDLLETLGRTPYQPLYYVEEPQEGTVVLPSGPFTDESTRDAWLETYDAQRDDDEPPMPVLGMWEMEPLGTMLTTAVHVEIARLLGLSYVDTAAQPDIEYDYRIVGYWADRTRRWTVEEVVAASTAPLIPPVLDVSDSPMPIGILGGQAIVDDRAVGLSWTPPTNIDVPAVSGLIDSIKPLLFTVEHQEIYRVPDTGVSALAALGNCSLPVSDAEFTPARRDPSNPPDGDPDIYAPSLVSPLEDELGTLSWPQYFFYHRALPYGCHAYRVLGKDVFGRFAAPSNSRVVAVNDLTPPPPPTMVRVLLYQRSDLSMVQSVRDDHFPTGSTNEFSVQVSWVWPLDLAARAPDLSDFRIYAVLSTFDPFPAAGVTADPALWRDTGAWSEGPIGPPVPLSSDMTLPDEYASLLIDGETPLTGAKYFEQRFTEVELGALGITLDDLGLEVRGLPGDQDPVRYTWFGVTAADRAPYGNEGDVSPPILTLARDLYPPDPPQRPELSGGPFEADDKGNRALEVSSSANTLYRYAFYRLDASTITPDTTITDAELPACFDFPPLIRPPNISNTDWLHMQRRRAIHETVARDLDAETANFIRMSPLLINEESGRARFSDSSDATESREYLYTAVAIDKGGNQSALSCPSEVILVEDGVPPRVPVFREVLGDDEAIRVTWTINTEGDLFVYNLYRTSIRDRIPNRVKLRHIAGLATDATDILALEPATADGTLVGTDLYAKITFIDQSVEAGVEYYYRLDAQDIVGNRSAMSEVASGAAFDATPPAKLDWAEPSTEIAADSSSVTVRWIEPLNEPGLRIQLQRRVVGRALWRTMSGGWQDGTAGEYVDSTVKAGSSYEYRVRGMDQAGNRAMTPGPAADSALIPNWSDVLIVDIPTPP